MLRTLIVLTAFAIGLGVHFLTHSHARRSCEADVELALAHQRLEDLEERARKEAVRVELLRAAAERQQRTLGEWAEWAAYERGP